MFILGINLSHCSSLTLIKKNKIIFFQEEERLSRIRRHKGWPKLSLEYMFSKFNLKEEDIDYCIITDLQSSKNFSYDLRAKKVFYIHHHLAHIFSCYVFNNEDNFTAISIDGGGDFNSWMSIAKFENKKLKKWVSNCGHSYENGKFKKPLFFKNFLKPLGTYWSHPCVLNFGMVDKNGIGGYEGKLMGLAARGDRSNFINTKENYNADFSLYKKNDFYFIKTTGNTKIGNKNHVITSDGKKYSLKRIKELRKQNKIIIQEYDLKISENLKFASDFADLIQNKTEEIVLNCFKKNNFKKNELIVLSGGIFGNVLMNGKLNKNYKIRIVPTMGDEGLSLGAAAWGAYINNINLEEPKNLYLGVEMPYNDSIDFELIGDYLKENKVIGLIEGKMEAGPRALGGRSILANPSWTSANQSINERLGRVEYMPFAPVILEEYADQILEDWNIKHFSSKHMTFVYSVKKEWRDKLAGVVHIDGTVRPQIINEDTNRNYYKILKTFYQKTNIPVLINTSFNLHGEPIINTYDQAIESLKSKKIDVLIINDKIITNQ